MVQRRRENGGLDSVSLADAYLQDQKLLPPLVALALVVAPPTMVIFFPYISPSSLDSENILIFHLTSILGGKRKTYLLFVYMIYPNTKQFCVFEAANCFKKQHEF